MRLRDDQVRDHIELLVRDARRNLDEVERSITRMQADVLALEARAARGRDRLELARRLHGRLVDALAGPAHDA